MDELESANATIVVELNASEAALDKMRLELREEKRLRKEAERTVQEVKDEVRTRVLFLCSLVLTRPTVSSSKRNRTMRTRRTQ